MTNIEMVPIKEIGRVVTGKTPLTSVADYYDGEYMFVTPLELHTDFMIRESQKTLTRKGLDSVRSNSISGLSIAVGCIGWDMGNVALIDKECATNQQINSITDVKPGFNPYYLYYWLLTKKDYFPQIATVTRTPILNKTTFEEVLVPMPSQEVQDRIVSFLLPISKKIAANNAINTELEKAAKLLYDYWFVQFDFPNVDGKPYNTSGGAMEYSEELKCEIPKGRSVVSFSEVIAENKRPLAEDVDKDGMFGLDLSIMPSNTMCLKHRGDASDFDSNRFSLSRYDLLFGSIRSVFTKKAGFSAFDGVMNGTTIMKLIPRLPNFVPFGDGLPAWMTIMNFRCKEEQNYSFALCTLTNEGLFQYADARSRGNGTRMPTISATELLDYSFAYDKETAMAFHKQLSLYWKLIADNINQNFELIAFRDFLPPLLMNGQVTVASEPQ